MKLDFDKEMGQVLGLLAAPAQQLTGILENSGARKLTSLLDNASRGTTDLLSQYLKDKNHQEWPLLTLFKAPKWNIKYLLYF